MWTSDFQMGVGGTKRCEEKNITRLQNFVLFTVLSFVFSQKISKEL